MKKVRIWSKKIFQVIEAYHREKNLSIFGMTGDLDNLGLFVSQHGRPLAENLVDVYNRLIGSFMYGFVHKNSKDIPAFCMIPSGEEIFAIGAITAPSIAQKFFSSLKGDVNSFIAENALVSESEVTVSFGCKVFSDEVIRPLVSRFVKGVGKHRMREASLAYLELMLTMRQELAYELDCAKFQSLDASESDLVVFLRNVVYAKLRRYKTDTKQTLLVLAERLRGNPELCRRLKSLPLNADYGVTDEDIKAIDSFLK